MMGFSRNPTQSNVILTTRSAPEGNGSTNTSDDPPLPFARHPAIPRARFAALAIEAGCEWITLDGDYARFPGLKWRVPPAGE
jgi:hypothetical protein